MSMDGNLRLRHIRVFLEIARSESVSIAADKLNVTQPAVSRALKGLEDILGRQLFDRVGRGIRLNEAGRVFQAHASVAMGELSLGRERLGRESGLTTRRPSGSSRRRRRIFFRAHPWRFSRNMTT